MIGPADPALLQRVAQAEARVVAGATEIDQLRTRVGEVLTALAAAREEARVARTTGRQITLDALIQAFAVAIADANQSLDGQQLTNLDINLRVAFGVQDGKAGILVQDVTLLDPRLVSSVTFGLRLMPPAAGTEGPTPR